MLTNNVQVKNKNDKMFRHNTRLCVHCTLPGKFHNIVDTTCLEHVHIEHTNILLNIETKTYESTWYTPK